MCIHVDTNMWTGAVYERCWLKDADLIFISCCYFSCVCAAVQTADSDVIVHSTGNYLNSLKVACQDHNIASSRICLYKCIVQEIEFIKGNSLLRVLNSIYFFYFCVFLTSPSYHYILWEELYKVQNITHLSIRIKYYISQQKSKNFFNYNN